MEGKAVKFGGTSLCDAIQMKKAAKIVQEDTKRRVIVVSAPGKRTAEDEKMTDLLIRADHAQTKTEREAFLSTIEKRFDDMILSLGLALDFGAEYGQMRLLRGDALISRGEYFAARIFSSLLGFPFLDASDCIFFRADGALDERKTRAMLSETLSRMENAVIPGFYGRMPNGEIRLFSRGGSDITGAIVADAMDADIYENFTDVSGFLLADPHLIADARTVPIVSYRELRYLSSLGAGVFHADAILPLRKKQIPIVIRNTNDPHGAHTWVVFRKEKGIGGIVGAPGYTLLVLERTQIGEDHEAVLQTLSILSAHGFAPVLLSHEVDAVSVLIRDGDYEKADAVAVAMQKTLDAELVTVRCGLSGIAVVGEGLTAGACADILCALEKKEIKPCFFASDEASFSFFFGVSAAELSLAVRVVYDALLPFLSES